MAEISLIVPIYRVEQYIFRCIDSVLSQTYTDFELILVDDGSPDNCGSICDEYALKDERVHVIHKENGGLSDARNAGIDWVFAHCSSKWIGFLDSDDWIHPKYLELLLCAAIRDQVNISIGEAVWTSSEKIIWEEDARSTVWSVEAYFKENPTNATVAWGKLYNKSLFQDIRFPVGRIYEDEFTTYKILFGQKKVSVIGIPLYAYFQNPSGIMLSGWSPRKLDCLDALEEQVAFFVSNGYIDIAEKRFILLIWKNIDSRKSILQCRDLTKREQQIYMRRVKRQLKRIILKYKKYGWLPLRRGAGSKQIYIEAFASIRLGVRTWELIKNFLRGDQ